MFGSAKTNEEEAGEEETDGGEAPSAAAAAGEGCSDREDSGNEWVTVSLTHNCKLII
jgi:hypothetical protein